MQLGKTDQRQSRDAQGLSFGVRDLCVKLTPHLIVSFERDRRALCLGLNVIAKRSRQRSHREDDWAAAACMPTCDGACLCYNAIYLMFVVECGSRTVFSTFKPCSVRRSVGPV